MLKYEASQAFITFFAASCISTALGTIMTTLLNVTFYD